MIGTGCCGVLCYARTNGLQRDSSTDCVKGATSEHEHFNKALNPPTPKPHQPKPTRPSGANYKQKNKAVNIFTTVEPRLSASSPRTSATASASSIASSSPLISRKVGAMLDATQDKNEKGQERPVLLGDEALPIERGFSCSVGFARCVAEGSLVAERLSEESLESSRAKRKNSTP